MDFLSTVKALENSPKGQLKYETGWDKSPNAITSLISAVQEKEIDRPNRHIVERAFTCFYDKNRLSYSPKISPTARVSASRSRRSLPISENLSKTDKRDGSSTVSPSLLSSFLTLTVDGRQQVQKCVPVIARKREHGLVIRQSEPRIEVQEVLDDASSPDFRSADFQYDADDSYDRSLLLTPPTNRIMRRKKSFEGSPIFKPSPSFSSSTQTQTHSSATSDATTTTPTRTAVSNRTSGKFGICDDMLHDNADQLEDDLLLESRISPFHFIQNANAKYQDEEAKRIKDADKARVLLCQKNLDEINRKIAAAEIITVKHKLEKDEAWRQLCVHKQQANLRELQSQRQARRKQEGKQIEELKAAAIAAEASRRAAQEVAKQEQIRAQQATEAEQRHKEADLLEKQLLQQKAAEENRIAEEIAATEARKKEEHRRAQEVVPELTGLILKEDLSTYAKTTDLLKTYEESTSQIDGKIPATKSFYIGAVKCINTPLNALADTSEGEIMAKVQHLTMLLSGEPVSGGGSMATMFTCKAIPNGDHFVMKTLAFRFVKKAEADVTRGKSTVQPLATVGVQLCKKFPQWACLVQAYLYKLCPFLVPFSHPQNNKSIQEYAMELGHDLSGTETAIQQTFLDRLKGYCTLYALMLVRFQSEGGMELGSTTSFFTMGGAWHILAATIKLEPQVDVTATVIHTLLDILDDNLHAIYKTQFIKLMRLLILNYLPKIRSITPPTKSGSVSRLQIYLEKKYTV